ncbi:MAG: SH3 domain-containing protein [Candidatus Riflebacteria bacterium]|nr:SH3 domain-containing protein [Candidatus Riflebacteria bacterium]
MKKAATAILLPLILLVAVTDMASAATNPFESGNVNVSDFANTPADGAALAAIAAGKSETGVVDVSDTLNIRTSPWGDIIGNLKGGAKVTIVGQTGDWYKISVNGKTAYVHSAYIKRQGEGNKSLARSGRVNAKIGLNVRRVPNGDIIGGLKNNQSVEILGLVGDWYKIRWGNNEAFVHRNYIDTTSAATTTPSDGIVKQNFVGYVTASALNVRTSPWGTIDGTLPSGVAVKVTGKKDDWFRIEYNGKVRYVHSDYISKTKASSTQTAPASTPVASGSLQKRIVAAARNLIGSTQFRTADVDYGNLACAKVVTTALKNAGALSRVQLNVRSTVADLKSAGWKEVKVPPFAEGDVITWKTYDYTGDGVKDPDTHVGIIVKEGNSYKAMNNSSSLRKPRLSDPYSIGPVCRVLRKV